MLRPTHFNSILKWILLTVIITGCSSTSLVYNNADWLVRGKIDDYFQLSEHQQRQLKQDISTFFQWHRLQELVEYSNVLTQFNQQFSDGLSMQEIEFFLDKLSSARIRFAEASIQSASLFLSTVSSEQVDYFDQEFRQNQAEETERLNLSQQEFKDENHDSLVDTLEDWFGRFDEDQLAQLRVISDSRLNNQQYWFDQREIQHYRLSKFLRLKLGREKIQQYLHNRFIALNRHDDESRKIRLQSTTYWRHAMLDIDKIITTKQRKKMIRKLDDYASDFMALSKQTKYRAEPSSEK
jgi:hypothetical protein